MREEIAGVTLGVVTAEMLSEADILSIHLSLRMNLVDTSVDGIFEWDVTTMNAINKWNVTGTTKEKQLVLVSYLFELVYDLMITPGNNVSVNGGFESCHGYVTE